MTGQPHLQRKIQEYCRLWVCGIIIAAPLAMGGAHYGVNAALCISAVILVTVFALSTGRTDKLRGELPVVLVGAALVFSMLQVIEFPMELVQFLSPKAHGIWVNALGEAHRWATLSVAPWETYHEVLKLITYLCLAVLVGNLFRRLEHRLKIQEMVVFAGAVVALVGFVHMALGQTQSFSRFGRDDLLFPSTLVNPNHLAGFLGLSSLVSIGLALERVGGQRWWFRGMALVTGSGVFLSLSRAGILAYCVALLLFAITWSIRQPKAAWRLMFATIGLTAVGGGVVASIVGLRSIVYELWTLGGEHAFSKTKIWESVPKLLTDFPVIGIGRGAFSSLGPRYFDSTALTWTHLENEWLQTLVDWGPVAGGIILCLGGLTFLAALFRGSHLPTHLAPLFGLGFLGVQNLMDFSFTVTGVAIPAIAILSSHLARLPQEKKGCFWDISFVLPKGLLVGGILVALVGLGAGMVHKKGRALSDDLQELKVLAQRDNSSWSNLETRAYEMMKYRPASYLIPMVMAQRACVDLAALKSGMRWINRALFLNPYSSLGDLFAARMLWNLGAKQQSILQYRLANQKGYSMTRIATEVFNRADQNLDTVKMLGGGDLSSRVALAGFMLRKGAPNNGLEILGDNVGQVSERWHVMRIRLYKKLEQFSEAKEQAERLIQAYPASASGYRAMAGLFSSLKQPQRALAELDRGLEAVRDKGTLLKAKVQLLIDEGELEKAKEVANYFLTISLRLSDRGIALTLLASIEAKMGRRLEAIKLWRRSIDIYPREQSYLSLSALREKLMDYDGAIAVLEEGKAYIRPKVHKQRLERYQKQLEIKKRRLKRDFSLR